MSNEKLPDFSDIDWDAALDEWEQRVVVAPGDDPDKGKGKDEGSAAAAAPPKAPKPPPPSQPTMAMAVEPRVSRPEPSGGEERRGGLGPLFARGKSVSPPARTSQPPTVPPFGTPSDASDLRAPDLRTPVPDPPPRADDRVPDSARTRAVEYEPPPRAEKPARALPTFADKSSDDAQTRAFTMAELTQGSLDDDELPAEKIPTAPPPADAAPADPAFFDRAPPEGRTRAISLEELAAAGEIDVEGDLTSTRATSGAPRLRPRAPSQPTLVAEPLGETSPTSESSATGAFGRIDDGPSLDDDIADAPTGVPAAVKPQTSPKAPPPVQLDPLPLEPSAGGFVPRSEVFRPPPTFEAERPAHDWLDGAALDTLRDRASWLEDEARALEDAEDRARALLSVSELRAIAGDADTAVALAAEARQIAPHLPLTWAQTRGLTPPSAPHALEELDAEVPHARTAAARVHATLLAADVARASSDLDGARARWEQATKLDPVDVRAPLALAADALGRRDHTSPSLRLSEVREFEPLDKAVSHILALRGAPRSEGLPDALVPNDAIRRLRHFVDLRDFASAQATAAEIGRVVGLTKAAAWLSSAFGALAIGTRKASQKTLRSLSEAGDRLARRAHVARSLELSDKEAVLGALTSPDAFSPEEIAVLTALAGGDPRPSLEPLGEALDVLRAALCGATFEGESRASHVAGDVPARAKVRLARLAAAGAATAGLAAAHGDLGEPTRAEDAVLTFRAIVDGDANVLGEALATLASSADSSRARDRHLARALVAERSGDRMRAAVALRAAREGSSPAESWTRMAIAADDALDVTTELLETARGLSGATAAILRLEATTREDLPDETRQAEIVAAHADAPGLGLAAFLAERGARRAGDEAEVLRWTRERRQASEDALELALDGVREALLVADVDMPLAAERVAEAHAAFPNDVALRELYERLDPQAPRAPFREAQSAISTGDARALFAMQAALEHVAHHDTTNALAQTRRAVEAGADGPATVLLDRLEIEAGEASRLADVLLEEAKAAETPGLRREAYERLAELDAKGRKDQASALLWHRSVLEEEPSHLPSLRYIEHSLVGEGRDAELDPVFVSIAQALGSGSAPECSAHAYAACELRTRAPEGGGWETAFDVVKLAYESAPTLWATRALYSHARARKDDALVLVALSRLLDESTRASETASLLLRASEAAARLGSPEDAKTYLERAAAADPGDVITWGFLAEVRSHAGDLRGAAEACESQARTSVVREHQLVAWYDAARTWLESLGDEERGVLALEQAAMLDASYADVYDRLFALYTAQKKDVALAELLESRLATIEDPEARVSLEVQLGRALAEMGDVARAREVLKAALDVRPDHREALFTVADIYVKEGAHEEAESAYVALSRLALSSAESVRVFDALATLYAGPLGNLGRAEVALQEVLKHAPDDVATLEKLVAVYRRRNDVPRAVEVKQQVVGLAKTPEDRLARLVELSQIHETTGRDPRKAEQTLEAARKEFPLSVVALRALAEFFARHNQQPAMHVLLDRAASDARRAFAGGRFVTSLFETLATAYELRGKADAARVVSATLAAISDQPSDLRGAELAAASAELDDLLAPEVLSPALRGLLARAGDGLDRGNPMDSEGLDAIPLDPSSPLAPLIKGAGNAMGLSGLLVLVSPRVGAVALPKTSTPPTIVLGERLLGMGSDKARAFLIVRALKLVSVRASALVRGKSEEVNALVSAWLSLFNPSWKPANVPQGLLGDMQKRLRPTMPAEDAGLGVMALEAAGQLGTSGPQLRSAIMGWANRVALLAVGDPGAALDAIAWTMKEDHAPHGAEERPAWVARNAEARDLMTFSVSDAYAEARSRLGL
ncbi:MAG: tetratricopeptide repeat protein [Polyangiaceae bacterium]